jgi:hypothetical protein
VLTIGGRVEELFAQGRNASGRGPRLRATLRFIAGQSTRVFIKPPLSQIDPQKLAAVCGGAATGFRGRLSIDGMNTAKVSGLGAE